MVLRLWVLAALAIGLATATPATAQVSDLELANRVAETVRKYPQFTIFDDVTITVKNRVVTVSGRVTQPLKKDELGTRIGKIDGIRTFVNDIGVLPVSQVDADLRQRLAKAIYGHPLFYRYAEMTDRPIHIVVENGRVTLTGYVADTLESSMAAALAQVPGALSVKNALKIDK
jgi:osmotically-inducible protein OsmY